MKLFYNKTSKDPIYYAQVGIRNGKKVTTKNVKRFGKHSELLKITDDPLSYVKEEIRKMNEEYRVGKVEYTFSTNYNERVEQTDDEASASTERWVLFPAVFDEWTSAQGFLQGKDRRKKDDL